MIASKNVKTLMIVAENMKSFSDGVECEMFNDGVNDSDTIQKASKILTRKKKSQPTKWLKNQRNRLRYEGKSDVNAILCK